MDLKTIYYGLLGLCLVILLLRFRKIPSYFRWFIPLISVAMAVELLKAQFGEWKYFIERMYQPVECLLLLVFYYHLYKTPIRKRFVKIIYPIYLLIILCYYLLYKTVHTDSDYFDFTVQALIVCILVVTFFFDLLDHKEQVNLLTLGTFWINAANFIFYGGCFFAMAYYGQIKQKETVFAKEILKIPYYLNLFLYTVYSAVFLLVNKKANAG